MTISYSGNFFRILLRWKGSIWKSTWKELLIYLCAYYGVRCFYLFAIPRIDGDDNKYKKKFEVLCGMFDNFSRLIPITFLLGFYVSNVVSRRMFAVPTLIPPRLLFGPYEEEEQQDNRECLKALGLPSTSIGVSNLPNTSISPPAPSADAKKPMKDDGYRWMLDTDEPVYPVYAPPPPKREGGRVRKKKIPGERRPVIPLLYRRLPCAVCDRPLDVFACVVMLPCAHIAHPICYEEMITNSRICDMCKPQEKRTRSESLLYFFCCMWSWE